MKDLLLASLLLAQVVEVGDEHVPCLRRWQHGKRVARDGHKLADVLCVGLGELRMVELMESGHVEHLHQLAHQVGRSVSIALFQKRLLSLPRVALSDVTARLQRRSARSTP